MSSRLTGTSFPRALVAALALVLVAPLIAQAPPAELRNGVLVLPLRAGAGLSQDDASVGLAISNLFEHMLILNRNLEECWFLAHATTVFPADADLLQWVRKSTVGPPPAGISATGIRFLVTGAVRREGASLVVDLVVSDRKLSRRSLRTLGVDTPSLRSLREGFADLLNEAGVPGSEDARARMLWNEDLPEKDLILVSRVIEGDVLQTAYGRRADPSLFVRGAPSERDSYLAHNSIGWARFRNDAFGSARSSFERAVAANASGVDAADGLAWCAAMLGDFDTADLWESRKARMQGREPRFVRAEFWKQRATRYYVDEQPGEAFECFVGASELVPEDADNALSVAGVGVKIGRFEDVLMVLRRSLSHVSPADREKITRALAGVHFDYGLSLSSDDKPLQSTEQYFASLAIGTQRPHDRAAVIGSIAQNYMKLGHPDAAVPCYLEALPILREEKDRSREAVALTDLGVAYGQLARAPEAIESLERARRIVADLGQASEEMDVLDELGSVYVSIFDFDRAIPAFEEGLRIARRTNTRKSEAFFLSQIGRAKGWSGRLDAAIESHEQALSIARGLKDADAVRIILIDLAGLYNQDAQYKRARETAQQALDDARLAGDEWNECMALANLGRAEAGLNNLAASLPALEAALALANQTGNALGASDVLVEAGFTFLMRGDLETAVAYHRRAIEIIGGDDLRRTARAHHALAVTFLTFDHPRDAVAAGEEAIRIWRAARNLLGEKRSLDTTGAALVGIGEFRTALGHFQRSLELSRQLGDRRGEEVSLLNIGSTQGRLSEYEKSLDSLEAALAIARQIGDRANEGLILARIADARASLGQVERALAEQQAALAILRETGNTAGEISALMSVGLAMVQRSELEKAKKYLDEALSIARRTGNRSAEGSALGNIGVALSSIGRNREAVPYLEQALAIDRESGNRYGEARMTLNLGIARAQLGAWDDAMKAYADAIHIMRETGDRQGEVTVLLHRGNAFLSLEKSDDAVRDLEEAVAAARDLKDRELERSTLITLGAAYRDAGQDVKAAAAMGESLTIAREIGSRYGVIQAMVESARTEFLAGSSSSAARLLESALAESRALDLRNTEGSILNNLGRVRESTRQFDKALEHYHEALAIAGELQDTSLRATAAENMTALYRDIGWPRIAILFGKVAVNSYEELRRGLRWLDADLGSGFVRSREAVYRMLADMLIEQGRLGEAQQVLDMLKEEEYAQALLVTAGGSSGLTSKIEYTGEESPWMNRYREAAARMAATAAAAEQLRGNGSPGKAEREQLARLESDLARANAGLHGVLTEMGQFLGKDAPAGGPREPEISAHALTGLDPGTVVLYTLVSDKKYWVTLITSNGRTASSSDVEPADLNRKIFAWRSALQNPSADPNALGRELYDILLGPVEQELKASNAHTLLLQLDGPLRYLPFAALWDGERYLAETWRTEVYTPGFASRKQAPRVTSWSALGVGVSRQVERFAALPNVRAELGGIIRDARLRTNGVLPGTIRLDDEFTRSTFLADLGKRYPVVHVASHFVLLPAREPESFLLLGDGDHMTMGEIEGADDVFSGVDLLVLSACDTAVGGTSATGRELEGLAVLAQRKGAKSVLASLWPVDDAGTRQLMEEFYRRKASDPATSNAEALRQAQLLLITGRPGDVASTRGVKVRPQDASGKAATTGRTHPYYWAPFVLMSSAR